MFFPSFAEQFKYRSTYYLILILMAVTFRKLSPPQKWRVAVIILLGFAIGSILFIFYVSNAYSYLSDNPKTCMNCHVMAPQFATWEHSSHKSVTNCNDCHVPHNNLFNKYIFKAKDGLRHATIFTLRHEPQVIRILDNGKQVVHNNCIRCHQTLIHDFKMQAIDSRFNQSREDRHCWDCHRETPHGKVNSLSSVPYARVPVPGSVVPDWLTEK